MNFLLKWPIFGSDQNWFESTFWKNFIRSYDSFSLSLSLQKIHEKNSATLMEKFCLWEKIGCSMETSSCTQPNRQCESKVSKSHTRGAKVTKRQMWPKFERVVANTLDAHPETVAVAANWTRKLETAGIDTLPSVSPVHPCSAPCVRSIYTQQIRCHRFPLHLFCFLCFSFFFSWDEQFEIFVWCNRSFGLLLGSLFNSNLFSGS